MNEKIISDFIKVEYRECPLAEDQDDLILFKASDKLHNLPGIYSIVKSRKSGLIRTNPRPTPGTIGFYYPKDYGPYTDTIVTKQNIEAGKSWSKDKILHNIFSFNSNKLPDQKIGKMLEIGCASGSFMVEMNNKGWEVAGIEYSAQAAKNAQNLGFKVHIGSLEEAPAPEELLDLVVGRMVLEHLHEPIIALEKLHGWTAKDGWAVFSVPNANSFLFKYFKDDWYDLDIPRHLYHYTPSAIKKIFDKAGWKVQKIHHYRTLTSLFVSLSFKLEKKGFNNKLTKFMREFPRGKKRHYLLYPIAFILATFGQTGRMTIWATKKSND